MGSSDPKGELSASKRNSPDAPEGMVFRWQGYVVPFRKATEKGFSEMYGLGWGGREPYFCEFWPLL